MNKVELLLTLYDDEHTKKNLTLLNRLEALFDHPRNTLPLEYFYFSDHLPLGSKVKITFEVVE